MGERARAVHFGEIDNLAQRFIMRRRVTAAARSEGDRQCSAESNILIGDMQRRRQILQCFKAHIE